MLAREKPSTQCLHPPQSLVRLACTLHTDNMIMYLFIYYLLLQNTRTRKDIEYSVAAACKPSSSVIFIWPCPWTVVIWTYQPQALRELGQHTRTDGRRSHVSSHATKPASGGTASASPQRNTNHPPHIVLSVNRATPQVDLYRALRTTHNWRVATRAEVSR